MNNNIKDNSKFFLITTFTIYFLLIKYFFDTTDVYSIINTSTNLNLSNIISSYEFIIIDIVLKLIVVYINSKYFDSNFNNLFVLYIGTTIFMFSNYFFIDGNNYLNTLSLFFIYNSIIFLIFILLIKIKS